MSTLRATEWATPELLADLAWPGKKLEDCELLNHGWVEGFYRSLKSFDFVREESGTNDDDQDASAQEDNLSWFGIACHPPMEGGSPIDTGQEFWHVRHSVTGAEAILRYCVS